MLSANGPAAEPRRADGPAGVSQPGVGSSGLFATRAARSEQADGHSGRAVPRDALRVARNVSLNLGAASAP